MTELQVARRYARALVEIARAKDRLDEIEVELGRVVSGLEANEAFRQALASPRLSVAEKQRLLDETFSGLSETTRRFLAIVVEKGRQQYLPAMVRIYQELADEARGELEVEVFSARPLPAEERERLRQVLSRQTGRKIRLQERLDPTLIGGVALKVGDRVADGSLRARLRLLREALVKAG